MSSSSAVRALRLVGAGLASGIAGGVAAGLGARVVMFLVRLANPAFNGATTHAGFVNGRWTVEGTMNLVSEALFMGLFGGALYLLVRTALLGPTIVRGLLYGALLLAVTGLLVLDGGYEYSRHVSPAVSVSAFASLYLLYGAVVAGVADVVAPRRSPVAGWRRSVRVIASVLLLLAGSASLVQLGVGLRFRYGF